MYPAASDLSHLLSEKANRVKFYETQKESQQFRQIQNPTQNIWMKLFSLHIYHCRRHQLFIFLTTFELLSVKVNDYISILTLHKLRWRQHGYRFMRKLRCFLQDKNGASRDSLRKMAVACT